MDGGGGIVAEKVIIDARHVGPHGHDVLWFIGPRVFERIVFAGLDGSHLGVAGAHPPCELKFVAPPIRTTRHLCHATHTHDTQHHRTSTG